MTDFAPHDQWLIGSEFTDYYFVANDKMKTYLINKNISEDKKQMGIDLFRIKMR